MLNSLYPVENLTVQEAEAHFMKENRPTPNVQILIRPEEIAHFVTFLSSSLSSAINGATLLADGDLVRSVLLNLSQWERFFYKTFVFRKVKRYNM